MVCKHCGAELIDGPELDSGEWVLCCLDCGAKNLVEAAVEIVGWRL